VTPVQPQPLQPRSHTAVAREAVRTLEWIPVSTLSMITAACLLFLMRTSISDARTSHFILRSAFSARDRQVRKGVRQMFNELTVQHLPVVGSGLVFAVPRVDHLRVVMVQHFGHEHCVAAREKAS
jgi:hypothetical protein